ncbi:MAG TPA: nucleoside hydrolase [Candidatus Acidoferrum sp.]|nr:nucleoside hydrolase [Candidatus Acidoferrum sp.]
MARRFVFLLVLAVLAAPVRGGTQRRKVIIDEDCSGPGGSNLQAILLLVQSPEIDVLGITVVSGDQWRDEEMAHVLRLLEIIGRTDIPVVPGAVYPLLHRREEVKLGGPLYGKVTYMGAWNETDYHEPEVVPPLTEGQPSTKPAEEDAAHFLVRMVYKYPHEVTIYEGGPMTDLALAIAIDPHFAELADQLVFMGGSLNPQTNDPEFANSPRHEFNFWFDPEAAHIVLRSPWRRISCTPVDISIKTKLTPEMVKEIGASRTPLARYLERYYQYGLGADYMWDELAAAAWLDPSLITREEVKYMDVDVDHGAGYGNTLTWNESDKPEGAFVPVHIQMDLDNGKFDKMFVQLMTATTPSPR